MAINFLTNVSLNEAELQNFVIHNLGSAPTGVEGRLYFDTSGGGGSHDLKLYINGAWTSILDTTLSVATSGALGGIKIGYAENGKNYPVELSSEQAFVNVPWTDTVYSHPSHPGDDIDIDTTALTGATVISDLDINITTDTLGHVTDANASVATRTLTLANLGYTGATDANNYVHPNHTGQVTSSGDGATAVHFSAITAQTALGANFASADQVLVYDQSATALKRGNIGDLQTYMQNNLTFTTNTNDDVSNANLLDALANLESSGGAANENIVIGTDSGDTIVITGNLQVSGTTTTVNSETVNIADHNIVLDSNNATSAVINGAGITLEGGTGDDVTFQWSTAATAFEIRRGASLGNLVIDSFTVNSIRLNGTNITSTAAELNKLDGYTGGVTELNYLDTLHATGVTSTEFDYLDGVTSNIQTQLNAKASSGFAGNVTFAASSSSATATHNLNTRDITVQLYDPTTYETVYVDVFRTTVNLVTFEYRPVSSSRTYRCVITRI
ncbi:hypothetical protein N9Y89_01085 [bacterium]|nr:hypothetical protein [bacterium]